MVRPEELPHQEEIPEGVREEVGGESTTRVLQGQHDEDRERSRERRRSTVGDGQRTKDGGEPFACLQPSAAAVSCTLVVAPPVCLFPLPPSLLCPSCRPWSVFSLPGSGGGALLPGRERLQGL